MQLPKVWSFAARFRRPRFAALAALGGLALGLALAGPLSAHDEDAKSGGKEAGKEAGKAAPPAKDDSWEAPGQAKKMANPIAADEESIARGLAVYTKACASCHGPEGKGDGKSAKLLAKKPADLSLHAPHHSDGELFWKITEGKKPMPSFKKDLKENQRWDVVNYLRKLTGPAEASADSATKKAEKPPKMTPQETDEGHSHESHGGY